MNWKPDIVLYHGGCNDGFGAAWACWKRWGYGDTDRDQPKRSTIEYVPMGYGQPLPDLTDKNVLFVDFSTKRDVMIEAAKSARSIVVLDHHKTAEAELRGFAYVCSLAGVEDYLAYLSEGNPGDRVMVPSDPFGNVMVQFDMEKSGARLAWEFCFPGDLLPNGIWMIEDRDLWRFNGPHTHAFTKGLSAYPQDFDMWDWAMTADGTAKLIQDGEAIARYHDKMVKDACQNAYHVRIAGYDTMAVNVPYFLGSDCAHELLQRDKLLPFAAYWLRRADGMIQWGLRSDDGRLDVSAIARMFGGGGHRNAAGFTVPAC